MPSKISWNIPGARWAVLFVLLALLSPAGRAQEPVIIRPPDGPAYREGRILIIPKAGRAATLNQFHGRTGARLRKAFPHLGNIHVLELPTGVSAREAVNRYRQSGHVETADLDILFHASALPNDPRLVNGEQWHLDNFGQNGGAVDADIHASEAWNIMNSATNIIVAIVDSGLRLTHQDLAANLWTNPGEIPGNGIDDDHNGVIDDVHGFNATATGAQAGNPTDAFGHGTHVAGILGAVGNNGVGVCGVAWRVKIMPCRFLDGSGNGFLDDLIDCLNYARTNGARIVNCSFESASSNPTLTAAFAALGSAGLLTITAAGNSGADIDAFPRYPASLALDNIVSVMATTRSDTYGGFNYGATNVDLAAPGFDILSTYNLSDSNYAPLSGTSMAAPCVAGAAALLWAKFPGLTYQQVILRLLDTVDPLPGLAGRCRTEGRLNLARALSGSFTIQPARYSWVPTNGMASIALGDDAVSTARALPFPFRFGGRDYTNIYVGANGIIGFIDSPALTNTGNMDMPTAAAPNAIVCPLWDNLNPAAGGRVWFGMAGVAPYRSAVVSWVDVPHFVITGGQTRFTFQAILHESGQIAFQYALVQNGNPAYVSGKSATIGTEDFMGAVAARYSYNGEQTVTNNQAILFLPDGGSLPVPTLTRLTGPQGGQFQLRITAQLGQRCVVKASDDLSSWTRLATNSIPPSGIWDYSDTNASAHSHRFYQAVAEP